MHMVTNPLDNSTLQGRFDGYPIRRGHTRVKELLAAGVNVCVGHDSVMDPWYPLGYGDPMQAAFVLAHYGQMSGHGELRTLMDMVTWNPASALGLEHYGLLPGCRAGRASDRPRRDEDRCREGQQQGCGAALIADEEEREAVDSGGGEREPACFGRARRGAGGAQKDQPGQAEGGAVPQVVAEAFVPE